MDDLENRWRARISIDDTPRGVAQRIEKQENLTEIWIYTFLLFGGIVCFLPMPIV